MIEGTRPTKTREYPQVQPRFMETICSGFFCRNVRLLSQHRIGFSEELSRAISDPDHVLGKFFREFDFSTNERMMNGLNEMDASSNGGLKRLGDIIESRFIDFILPDSDEIFMLQSQAFFQRNLMAGLKLKRYYGQLPPNIQEATDIIIGASWNEGRVVLDYYRGSDLHFYPPEVDRLSALRITQS